LIPHPVQGSKRRNCRTSPPGWYSNVLFLDVAALPPGGVAGDPAFRQYFAAPRKADPLSTGHGPEAGLLKYRRSYMIYSPDDLI
jgi:hypothetical protein